LALKCNDEGFHLLFEDVTGITVKDKQFIEVSGKPNIQRSNYKRIFEAMFRREGCLNLVVPRPLILPSLYSVP